MSPPALESLEQVLARLAGVLRSQGITDFALTGAAALGVWTQPRVSDDLDICAAVPKSAVDPLLAQHDGIRVGPEEVPSIMRIQLGPWDIDIFVSSTPYDAECLRRAVPVTLGSLEWKVVTPEDLMIHKLLKLAKDKSKILQDAADLRSLVTARGATLDVEYIRRWAPASHARLIESAATLDPAMLVAQLAAL